MRNGAREFFWGSGGAASAGGIPYIMPDGGAYWDSGFVPGSGCEYIVNAVWLKWPRSSPPPLNEEYQVLCTHVYSGVCPFTFNYFAMNSDTVTTQAIRSECRHGLGSVPLNQFTSMYARHRVGDSYLRVGFLGGSETTVSKSSLSAQSESLYICRARGGGPFDGASPCFPDKCVMIFSIQMYRDGVLEKNFVPELDGTTPCFRETVGNTLVHSLGSTTGKFGYYAGPALVDMPGSTVDFNITGVSRQSRYFDSGVVPGENTKVELMLVDNLSPAYSSGGFQTGCHSGWVSGAMFLNVSAHLSKFWFLWNTDGNNVNDPAASPTLSYGIALATFNPGGFMTVSDPTGVLHSYNPGTNYYSGRSNSFFIGDVNENGTAKGRTDSQGSGRIGWVKFYESGVLTHNFRPFLSNGNVCMKDLVTGTVLQSAGNADAASLRFTLV